MLYNDEIDRFIIIQMDCLKAMRDLESESIDLIFADPPYWMRTSGVLKRIEGTDYKGCNDHWDNTFTSLEDYAEFTRAWLGEAKRLLKKDGSIWVIGSMQCIYTIGNALQELGYWLINDVVWWKNNPTPNMTGSRLCNAHETLIWAVKSEKAKFTFHYKTGKELNTDTVAEAEFLQGIRKQMGSVWRFPVCSGKERLKNESGDKLHSTQKPFALLHRIINLCSNPGDLVLDPFGGTFTTGAAALASGRRFIGIEKEQKYCGYGYKRLAACKPNFGPIEKAIFDIKPERISLQKLISKNYLHKGENLFLKSGLAKAMLLENGKIRLGDGEICDIHRGAALASNRKATRLNGFDIWHVIRDNKLVSLNKIRENARSLISDRSSGISNNCGNVEWINLL